MRTKEQVAHAIIGLSLCWPVLNLGHAALAGSEWPPSALADRRCYLAFPTLERIIGDQLMQQFLRDHPRAAPPYSELLGWIQSRADAGDAQFETALAFTMTDSFDPSTGCRLGDWSKALIWFRRAAEQGDAEAQSELGTIYMYGRPGVSRNETEAVDWLRKAADQGETSAQDELGLAYECGRGTQTSTIEAAKLYRLAADHGDTVARLRLKGLDPSSDAKPLLRPPATCADR